MTTFEDSVTVKCSAARAFEFLIQPSNVVAISPPEMGLSLVEAPERLALGSRMELSVQAYGIRQKLVHEVIEFEAPHRLVEQQVHGPMKFYRHEHVLHPREGGTVQLIDRVEFEPPGGLTGLLLTEDRVLKGLQHGFQYRYEVLKRRLETG
jgi:ligand-binding SRPBCC domain-containing protein